MDTENENNIKDSQSIKINVFYMNNKIPDFKLPSSLNQFRNIIKHSFLRENKNIEEISVIYFFIYKEKDKPKEKIIDVKTDTDYITMLNRIKSNEIKDGSIYIETDKIPNETSRINSKNFEEEIQYLIECQLKNAGEKIKKYFATKQNCSTKNEENIVCSNCYKVIMGSIYRSVIDINEKYFCEKCSFIKKDPVFIIH